MLVDRARMFLLVLFTSLLVACGGGGGSPGVTGPTAPQLPPPPASTGSLTVAVSNVPAGSTAAIQVTGPNNFAATLTQSQTLSNLTPGTYTVVATNILSGNVNYAPTPPTQNVAVTAATTVTATVAYAPVPIAIALSAVASNLDNPVFLTAPPGDTRQFIIERPGRIRLLQGGVLQGQPFLDLSIRIDPAGEGGMLSMAFDPAFATNGLFYVTFTNLSHDVVVERYAIGPNPNLADPTSLLPIIQIPHPLYTNHYGGLVAFGPDGYLYLGTGDGGSEGDPLGNGQNLDTLLGKLLRLDVRTATGTQPYAIPPTNPFAGQANRRGEIWAYGLRNPWRYAFDNGRLYIGDVGGDRREEVDLAAVIQGGLNYGWNVMEGSLCFNPASCNPSGLVLPVAEYAHGPSSGNACAIVGGYVYRGAALPELAGRYFYSDFCAGFLKSFFATDLGILEQRDWAVANPGRVVSFGQDGQGELYLLASNGSVWKIVRSATQQG